jgi:hypothetical protein
VAWGNFVPQAVTLVCASGLLASLSQGKNYRDVNNFVDTIIPNSVNESTESGSIFSTAATANVAPAIFSTVKSANINVIHDRKKIR